MTMLFLGQRVRVARATKKENIGRELNIQDFKYRPKGTKIKSGNILSKDCNCAVVDDSGCVYAACTSQLEPVLPEGHQPCGMSYEQMMEEFKEKTV